MTGALTNEQRMSALQARLRPMTAAVYMEIDQLYPAQGTARMCQLIAASLGGDTQERRDEILRTDVLAVDVGPLSLLVVELNGLQAQDPDAPKSAAADEAAAT